MSVWTGWQAALLDAANLLHSSGNARFINEWHDHANTNCHFNPVDISRSVGGSTNCRHLIGTSRQAQNYATHANAATAFARQLNSGNFPTLRAALHSGNPYTFDNPEGVARDLVQWGSGVFETVYYNETIGQTGTGGGSGPGHAPHALKGWSDLRVQINSTLPKTLRHVDKLNRGALSGLGAKRRVRR